MAKEKNLSRVTENESGVQGQYKNWFLDYASYVILERAVPAIEDGLKPVQRRILHAMKEMDDGRFNKVANIIGQSMHTTNDMPITMPQDFKTLGVIPYNINAHYLDPIPHLKHNGESRETRIKEFHTYHDTDVIGLREGSYLEVIGADIFLKGPHSARLFQKNQEAKEVSQIDGKAKDL